MSVISLSMVETDGGIVVRIDLESDRDVLGHEHERDHRVLAAELLGVRLSDLDDLGIKVQRVGPSQRAAATSQQQAAARGKIGTVGNPGPRRGDRR